MSGSQDRNEFCDTTATNTPINSKMLENVSAPPLGLASYALRMPFCVLVR
jgi:hypothetical protein